MLNWKEKIIFKEYIFLDSFYIAAATFLVKISFDYNLKTSINFLEMIGFLSIYLFISLFILNGFNMYKRLVRRHGKISILEFSFTILLLSLSTFLTSILLIVLKSDLGLRFYLVFNFIIIILIFINRVIISIFNKNPSKLSIENILLVGYSEEGEKYIDEILKRKYLDVQITGYLSKSKRKEYSKITYLGKLSDFKKIVRENVIDEITVTSFYSSESIVSEIIEYSKKIGITVNLLITDNHKKPIRFKTHAEMIGDLATVKLHLVSFNEYQIFIKRIIDVTLGIIGFIIFIVLYLILGPIIKLDSKGPILFKQKRIGKRGRIFEMYKFRTMKINAESLKNNMMDSNKMNGPLFKVNNDPRITRVGKFLRKTSLDEFPQFYNVLKGDMSVVGTRPPTVEEVKEYTNDEYQRISIVPGITGIWQVSGRSKITDFSEILRIEKEYIKKWNIYLDLIIILKTIKVVILCEGAE